MREPLTQRGERFTHRAVYPFQLPSVMRKHVFTGSLGGVWLHLISGLFFLAFGKFMGLTRLEWGVMAAVSSLLVALQPLSARLVERTGRRKAVWFACALSDRLLRMAGIVGAYLLFDSHPLAARRLLIGAVVAANFFGALGNPPWFSWLADLIPEDIQGRFWGRREAVISTVIMLVVVPCAMLLDAVPAHDQPLALLGLFAVASCVGLLDLIIHRTIPDSVGAPRSDTVRRAGRLDLRPLFAGALGRWLRFNAAWTFWMTLGGALAGVYMVEDLGFDGDLTGGAMALICATLGGAVVGGLLSAELVDRIGVFRSLMSGHLVWSALPLSWLFATVETAVVVVSVGSFIGGAASVLATNAGIKLITRMPPPGQRAMYVAISTSLGSLAGAAGALCAGVLLQHWNAPLALGRWSVGAFPALFFASTVGRFAVTFAMLPKLRGVTVRAPQSATRTAPAP